MALQHCYIVTYDICHPKRLRQVFREMKGWGVHIQYSVFQCNLTEQQLVELQTALEDIINDAVDQVLFIDVGRSTGRGAFAVTALGKAFGHKEGGSVIV